MRCRMCESTDVYFRFFVDGSAWFGCRQCGGDTREGAYEPPGPDYVPECNEMLIKEWTHNADLLPGTGTLLDVGCNEGAGLVQMRRRGWTAFGWDVNPAASGFGVTISEKLTPETFSRRFDAVVLREVLEHAEDWKQLLHASASLCRGVLQVQTPRPWDYNPLPYHKWHLQIFNHYFLLHEMQKYGTVMHTEMWSKGQLIQVRVHGHN